MYKKKNINMKHIPKIKNKIKLASDLESWAVWMAWRLRRYPK